LDGYDPDLVSVNYLVPLIDSIVVIVGQLVLPLRLSLLIFGLTLRYI